MKKLTLLTALAFIGASASAQADLDNTVIHLVGPSQSQDYNAAYNDYPISGTGLGGSTTDTITLTKIAGFVADTSDSSATGNSTYNGGSPATTVNYVRYTYDDAADAFQFSNNTNTEIYLGLDAPGTGFNGSDTAYENVAGTDTTNFQGTPEYSVQSGFIDNAFGNFDVTTAGTFTFSLNADDMAGVYLGGNLVLTDDYTQGTQTFTEALGVGTYSFDLLYFQEGGGQKLNYSASSSDGGVFEYDLAPEPSTIAMMAFGALGLGVIAYRRRAALI